jgi:hypothetical protein
VAGAAALGVVAWLEARGGGGAPSAAAAAAAAAAAKESAARGWARGLAAAEAEAAGRRGGWSVAALLPWAQPRSPAAADAATAARAFFQAGLLWGRAREAAAQLRERLRSSVG